MAASSMSTSPFDAPRGLENAHRGVVDEVVRVGNVFFLELIDEHFHIRIADGTEVSVAILQDEPRHFFFSVGSDRTYILIGKASLPA